LVTKVSPCTGSPIIYRRMKSSCTGFCLRPILYNEKCHLQAGTVIVDPLYCLVLRSLTSSYVSIICQRSAHRRNCVPPPTVAQSVRYTLGQRSAQRR